MRTAAPSLLALALAGCAFQEDLPQEDIHGKVILPRAAATRTVDGTEMTDVRFIGPVFLGAYSGIDTVSFNYPHPEMGPIITTDVPGDTFPYGGTTVGRFDYACYQALACKVVTGRFKDYADILNYFGDVLNNPVKDEYGTEIVDASTFQQECYDYFYATSDQEMAFIGDIDFTENADGDFQADFTMAHTTYVDGMVIWGWMDAPEISASNSSDNGGFSTCDTTGGRNTTNYDQDYYEGRVYFDALNTPSQYIYSGDWVGQGGDDAVVTKNDEGELSEPTVRLDFGFDIEEDSE